VDKFAQRDELLHAGVHIADDDNYDYQQHLKKRGMGEIYLADGAHADADGEGGGGVATGGGERVSEERRIDHSDGIAYTKKSFHKAYGGTIEWDQAEVAPDGLELPAELMASAYVVLVPPLATSQIFTRHALATRCFPNNIVGQGTPD
jgi:hypothetical protein